MGSQGGGTRWWPRRDAGVDVATVTAGLAAADEETRVSAAEKLLKLKGEEAIDLAIGCLEDPVPAVRYHALHALGKAKDGPRRLAQHLSDAGRTTEARTRLVDDLFTVSGKASPFPGMRGSLTAIDLAGIPTAAISWAARAQSRDIAIELIELLQARKRWPEVSRFFPRDPEKGVKSIVWPNRCCKCGSPNPTGHVELMAHGEEQLNYTHATADVVFSMPVCETSPAASDPPGGEPSSARWGTEYRGCVPAGADVLTCSVAPNVQNNGLNLTLLIPSPQFLIDLDLDHAGWFISGGLTGLR